ncbi:MAG TPA: PspC domain-containing protein [Flavobacteriales bacterium]|nr:PspC domain-containing protein [Flavobacteriales bacterium]
MKKTVTINLSGIIFHIDEDAHDKLNAYLNKIKGYFGDSESKDEIMADIEARIAEMLQEKIGKGKEVISTEDVDQVISVMGKPEDYVDADSTPPPDATTEDERSADDYGYTRKRVFRDPDNNVLGGVCGGIAAYFNFDPIWLRIVFAVSFFFFGSGFLLYVLLWLVIPKAHTTAEKLEMKGERVNVSNIEKSIKEELDNLKKKFNDFTEGASSGKKKPIARAKGLLDRIIDFVISLLTIIVRAIVKFIGVIFIAIGIVLLIMLFSSLLGSAAIFNITGMGIGSSISMNIIDIFFVSPEQFNWAAGGLLLLIGIPLIAIVYNGIKLLLGIKNRLRGLGAIAMALWIAGCILVGYVVMQIGEDFSKKGVNKTSIALANPTNNVLVLEVIGEEYHEDEYDIDIVADNWISFYEGDERIALGKTKLDVVRSKTDSFEIQLIYKSRGATRKVAIKRAENINYTFTQKDSLIQFDPYFNLPDDTKWRAQQVRILIKVPDSGSVYLDHSMRRIIDDIDNVTGTDDGAMVGKTWTMLQNGLTCVGCDEEGL